MAKPSYLDSDAKGYYDPDLNQIISEVAVQSPNAVLQSISKSSSIQVATAVPSPATNGTGKYVELIVVTVTPKIRKSKFLLTGYSHCYTGTVSDRTNLAFAYRIRDVFTSSSVMITSASHPEVSGWGHGVSDAWGTGGTSGRQLNRSYLFHPYYNGGFDEEGGEWAGNSSGPYTLEIALLGGIWEARAAYFNYNGYNHKNNITVTEIAQSTI
jgi:hypothetical protein